MQGDAVMPIAIIGVAGRFPGDADNPQKLWDMISAGRSALTEITPDRFNVDAYYHPHHERQGTLNVRKAHLMKRDIHAFDAPFFSLPQADAMAMDPQQRMALECTYEALENAGLRMDEVAGSNTSCYIGCFTRDYSDMLACDPEDLPLYHGTGTGSAIMSNRISWFFDFKGPSISLDTACSSSLAALHLGCQSLRTGETTMALVGGTNLIMMPDIMGAMTRLHFLSPDGKCQSFDHKGNGYSRGEGAGMIVLKPLHLALEHGDVIRGVIRNTAVNQDGNTPGITLPSGEAQEALIRRVYADAGLNLADTAYVEAHGTGTPAGDPVEAGALARTFGASRAPGDKLIMGSVKSNVGHLEGGSGAVQVIKAIMMLEKGEIPPSLYFEKPNPRIPMDEWNLHVPTELLPWPTVGLRRVSINSFGYGGTNAHCIIDDAYHYFKARGITGNHNVQGIESTTSTPDSGIDMESNKSEPFSWSTLSSYNATSTTYSLPPSPKLLLWTSNEQSGVERVAKVYAGYLADKVASDSTGKEDRAILTNFARTLAARRSILPWRSFSVSTTCKEAITLLENLQLKPIRTSSSNSAPKIAFVFTGQGAQWYAMGRELFAYPIFRESLETAGQYFASIGSGWSLVYELFRDQESSKLDAAELSQPICTALQVALVELFRSWAIKPTAVIGHSSGEIAAAYTKGAITRQDAWKIAYHRGHLSSCIRGFAPKLNGAMLAVGLGSAAVAEYVSRFEEGSVVVACSNSPASSTLSGDSEVIDQLEQILKKDEVFARKLRVNVAYHSPHVQVIADRYHQALGNIQLHAEEGDVKMFSTLTGRLVKSNKELNSSYWVSNMVSQVKFSEALAQLLNHTEGTSRRRSKKAFIEHLVEIGPHSALKGPILQIMGDESFRNVAADVKYHPSLERGTNACETALTVAGRMFQYGHPLHVDAILNETDKLATSNFLVDIPPFAWNHSLKYWSESHNALNHRFQKHPRKDLFGRETQEGIPREPRFRNILRLNEVPWTQYHRVQGSILYPAAGMMIMAIEAMCQKADPNREVAGYELRDILINKAIVIPQDESGVETMLTLKHFRQGSNSLSAAWQEFHLYSRQDTWELNCSGLIHIEYKTSFNPVFADEHALAVQEHKMQYEKVYQSCPRALGVRHFYDQLEAIGLYYGGVFQGLSEVRKGEYLSACRIRIPDTKSVMPHQHEYPHVIHPATLDSMIQLALPATCKVDEDITAPIVPVAIRRLYVSADVPTVPGTALSGYATSNIMGFDEGESTVIVSDDQWSKPLVIFEGIKGKKLSHASNGSLAGDTGARKVGTYFHWQEDLTLLGPQQIRELCYENTDMKGALKRQELIEIEMACIIFMNRVMHECSVEESEGFAWNFKLFYDYMQHHVKRAETGTLVYQADTPDIDWLKMDFEAEEALLDRVSKASTDGRALVQHGKHLPEILRGEIPPLQLMMADNFLHDFYQAGIGTKQHYGQMSWYVDQMAHKNPTMKILEIGGGTAGATLPLLTKLSGDGAPRFSRYTFTDISVGYFEKARAKLAPWQPFMNFAKLNIEEDPLEQGFEEGGYDLIVASNVLHATRFIGRTLENTRKLLKPTGKLVLTEVTPFQKTRFHMIVGSLEGWWYGEEDGRHFGPTLEIQQWHEALLKAGFNGVEHDFQDFPDPRDTGLSIIVAGASTVEEVPTPKNVVIVLPDTPENDIVAGAQKMSQELHQQGAEVSIVPFKDTASLDLKSSAVLSLIEASETSSFLWSVSEAQWTTLKHLILESSTITYVTRGGTVQSDKAFNNLMTGMARSIRSEDEGLSFSTVDAESGVPLDADETVAAILKVFSVTSISREIERPEFEYAIRGGRPMIQRVMLEKGINDLATSWLTTPKPEQKTFRQEGRPLTLGVSTPGRLDTLRFEDDKDAAEPLGADEVEITVKAWGLNFKDIMVAMGQLSQPFLGVECAGLVHRVGSNVTGLKVGTPIMTWKLGTFKNIVRAPAAMVQKVPEGMDITTAASIPVVYSTAYHSLVKVAKLRAGETVLIHGAAGGTGQAAIMLAQHIGAKVFATVSSEAKKTLLVESYGIPESHILNSRDATAFSQGVMRLTNNHGVDVVLNSLAGESLRLGWRSIARFGRFIELGQKDIVSNTGLDMEPFLRNATFHAVNMLDLLEHDLPAAAAAFSEAIELLHRGTIKPVTPINVMPLTQLEDAFRLMQTGKHMGKIVIETDDNAVVAILPAAATPASFRADGTYVIAGGGGGLGRAIAEWMVKHGAQNILLLSRSGTKNQAAKDLVARLRKQGARVDAWPCNVGDEEQVRFVVSRCAAEGWPAIKGVVQGAMDLRDSIFENMTHEQFLAAIHPKVQGSWNLHKHLPRHMDFFVCLSSSVGIAGSRGQGNYSAGNSYQDALGNHRRAQGLPACTIDVGMVLGVGFLADDTREDRVHDNVAKWSFLGIREREFLGILGAAIKGESVPGVPVPPQLITGLGTGGMKSQATHVYAWWFKDPKFSHLLQVDTENAVEQDGEESTPLAANLSQAASMDAAVDLISEALIKKLAKSLMVSVEDIEATKPVSSYGVDSLLAVELRTWIQTEIKAEVSVFQLLSNVPITTLAGEIAAASKAVAQGLQASE